MQAAKGCITSQQLQSNTACGIQSKVPRPGNAASHQQNQGGQSKEQRVELTTQEHNDFGGIHCLTTADTIDWERQGIINEGYPPI